MRVWFHPVDAPDVYLVVRPDAETTIFCISDGLLLRDALAAYSHLATVPERDWVRRFIGAPTVAEDPTYARGTELASSDIVWHRSMIPNGLLWEGRVPYGELSEATEREVAGDRPPTLG